ncbi:hypothetical protein COW36_00020 [bacterium (Candidatus Blackallbacteria) CG17_big_fil_post_rev_8_21_14_2_50_48_46]|uniref:Uncharacterized protein n=1 Tax=bacterium (Candidatus Blackallbacteria) CG17_big_fil_post_rev_8_21_14_2_50_48_46 TaxID=2014261 RepID=A0A2M7GBR5_9BACT|nr:MAG: hypothetical protein COW64_07870 [bacterium (Candidatus Blackallbacteria) CG18_big_fil_WC_8_21_14_2_50_49_26]PIW19654.1 MAG: hypothetical protein COW36_00020 [bacterium (Candidatus Blackallbacteria) CG17_big_fil_post_rev_8_21_14_2_50_48_46]PIW44725.1 MAG: hypothetical protein COW20_22935 [bacterium (Candidatus Blackallbacteria) CG13_big_fil_rev_8_21_14_2_50_49_14]
MDQQSQDFHRFQFIEVSHEPEPHTPAKRSHESFVAEIPVEQILSYLDLVAMRPTAASLKSVARKLQEKYRFIPIATQPVHLALRWPGHFDPQYHLNWEVASATHTLYIALCPQPRAGHVLRLIHNATGFAIYALPTAEKTFERFMAEQYQKLLG